MVFHNSSSSVFFKKNLQNKYKNLETLSWSVTDVLLQVTTVAYNFLLLYMLLLFTEADVLQLIGFSI